MKKALFILLAVMFAVGMAAAQTDILGPHNLNGHGCATCHAPHSGAKGNGGTDAGIGEVYLWGRDLIPATYTTFGGGSLTVPATITDETDPVFHSAACLSCHDGAFKPVGMKGVTVESTDSGATPPTYLSGDVTGGLANDHPVNVVYLPNPGGACASTDPTCSSRNWPSTIDVNGTITWGTDTATTNFTNSYGRPVRFYGKAGQAWIECSTCHNPHSMNLARSTFGTVKNAVKTSRFFVRGWYDSTNTASNSSTQFCRSCHYSKSNEYVGVTVPTT
jgi:hypothetical protein